MTASEEYAQLAAQMQAQESADSVDVPQWLQQVQEEQRNPPGHPAETVPQVDPEDEWDAAYLARLGRNRQVRAQIADEEQRETDNGDDAEFWADAG